MSTTLATNIEQSVSAQQLTTTDTEQALYHLHHQYQEQQQHEQLQLQDPSAIIHAPTATAELSPSHQQTSLSSPISAADSNGANSVKDGKRNGHGRMLFSHIHLTDLDVF